MLKLTANRETMIHRVSEQSEFARAVEIGELPFTNESVMDGISSTFYAENTPIHDIQDYKQL